MQWKFNLPANILQLVLFLFSCNFDIGGYNFYRFTRYRLISYSDLWILNKKLPYTVNIFVVNAVTLQLIVIEARREIMAKITFKLPFAFTFSSKARATD